jgi:periplasmic divalent cation tolerance protein
MSDLIIVITTVPNRAIALEIAKVLVEEKYGACVQILPNLTSTYMWEDKLCIESEQLLLVKTLADRYGALETKLRSIHPYTEPEIVAISAIAASDSYLHWVARALTKNLA